MTGGPEGSPRVIVVQTAFLGDVVLTTPLLAAARALFPSARIAFLGTPGGAELLSGLPGVEVMALDKRGADKGIGGLRKKAAGLKAEGFDLAICPHRSLRSAALARLSGARQRIGFATSDFPWLFTGRVPRKPGEHEVKRNLALLGPLGGVPAGFSPGLALPPPPPVDHLLGENVSGPRIGLCPGSVWETKRWPARAFGRLARMLREEMGARVYLLGAASDREAAEEAGREAGDVVNLAGKSSLKQWAGLIAAMDLVVTNDSAPTHIACAAGTPVVTVYGATVPSQGFAPWMTPHRIVETPLPCRPCGDHGGRRCPEGHFKCMETVTPRMVFEAAASLLAETKP